MPSALHCIYLIRLTLNSSRQNLCTIIVREFELRTEMSTLYFCCVDGLAHEPFTLHSSIRHNTGQLNDLDKA